MNNFAKFLKKILFLAICALLCYHFNACAVSAAQNDKSSKERYTDEKNEFEMKNDIKEVLDEDVGDKLEEYTGHKKKKYRNKKERKRVDWNDWHGLRSKKNIKTWQRYSKDEFLDNELKHYERTRQNLLNAYQQKNYDKRRQQRLEKYDAKVELQKNGKIKKDDDLKKANEKYLKYKDNIRKINQKYKNGEYTKVIVTNADNVVNDENDNDDNRDKEDYVDEKKDE